MSYMPRDNGGEPIPVLRPGRTAVSSVGAASVEVDLASAFAGGSDAKVFRLVATDACHIRTASGDATTDDALLPGSLPEVFKFGRFDTFRHIQAAGTSGGTLYITEML